MIENKNNASRNSEKALQALEQAKQRVANEKKKQNEKKRKAENHHTSAVRRLFSFAGVRQIAFIPYILFHGFYFCSYLSAFSKPIRVSANSL